MLVSGVWSGIHVLSTYRKTRSERLGVTNSCVPRPHAPTPIPKTCVPMFGERAFRTWSHVLAGACGIAVLFLGVMVMAEEVIGDGARVTRAGLTMSAAAFVGYVGVAWLIRLDAARSR